MTSTSITTVGGMVVVTQVIPQEEKGVALQAVSPTKQTATQITPPAIESPTKVDDMATTFLRAGPQALGVVQIMIGLMCILFSLTAIFSPYLLSHAPFCLAISFVISGSITVAAGKKTSVNHVQASLSWNVISIVFGLAGVAYDSYLLAQGSFKERICPDCKDWLWSVDVTLYGLLGLMLVLLVLQICVALTVCVFSGKALRPSRSNIVKVMVDGCTSPRRIESSDSDVALLDSDGEEDCPSPPNSP